MARVALTLPIAAVLIGCNTVDPGPNFVVPDEQFNADFFFCRIEPEILTAKKCGPGDPATDGTNSCHFNASSVSGMAIADHAPIDCVDGKPTSRVLIGAGSAAQGNLQAVTLVMSRDVDTAPFLLRPTGQNHPRAIFGRDDGVVALMREWATR